MQIALFFFFSEAVTQRCFVNKVVLRNLAKFTGKHMCQGLFFGKVTGLWPATLLKKRLWHRCFPVNFVKFLQTPFLTEHLWWLLLSFQVSLCYFPYASLYIIYLHLYFIQKFFSVFNFVLRCSFLQKKRKEKNIYRKSFKKWEIIVLTDRCIIKKMISKKNVM